MGTLKAAVIWALESKKLHHDLPVYMQKIGGVSILSHIVNNFNKGATLQKIAIVMHEDCYEQYKEQLEQEIFNLNEKIIFETFVDYEVFGDFFSSLINDLKCDELLLMNANLPFIQNSLLKEFFSVLNNPISKSGGCLPTAVLPESDDLKINTFLDDLEKSLQILKEQAQESLHALQQVKLICVHHGFIKDCLRQMNEDLEEKLDEDDCIDFINNSYLASLIVHLVNNNLYIAHFKIPEKDIIDVNNNEDLITAELIFQEKKRRGMIAHGVHMIDPATVFFGANVSIEKNVTIHSHVVFGRNVIIEEGATIKSYSHIENAKIGKNCVIGPFANIYNNVKIGDENQIGDFTSMQSSIVGEDNTINMFNNIDKTVIRSNNIIKATSILGSDDSNFSFIDNDCRLEKCTICPNIHIGNNVTVLFNTVVSENIAENLISYSKHKQYNRKKKKIKDKKEKILALEEV